MYLKNLFYGVFHGGPVVKNPPSNAALISGPGRSHMPWDNKAHALQLLVYVTNSWEKKRN